MHFDKYIAHKLSVIMLLFIGLVTIVVWQTKAPSTAAEPLRTPTPTPLLQGTRLSNEFTVHLSSTHPTRPQQLEIGERETLNGEHLAQQEMYRLQLDDSPSTPLAVNTINGQVAYVGTDGSLWIMDSDGNNHQLLTSDFSDIGDPTWSPNGDQIVFEAGNPRSIYLIDVNDTLVSQLASDFEDTVYFTWSPDGTRILFTGTEVGGTRGTYFVDVDGTSVTRLAYDLQKHGVGASWSPDGQSVAIPALETGRKWGVYKLDVETDTGTWLPGRFPCSTGECNCVDSDHTFRTRWSPDGSTIAFFGARVEEFGCGFFQTCCKATIGLHKVASDGNSNPTRIGDLSFTDTPGVSATVGDLVWANDSINLAAEAVRGDRKWHICRATTTSGVTVLNGQTGNNADAVPGGIAWSPDATQLVAGLQQGGVDNIYVLDPIADSWGTPVAQGKVPDWGQLPPTSTAFLTITNIEAVQVIEGADLVANKPLAIKVTIAGQATEEISDMQISLRYNNGASQLNSFYVNSPSNWNEAFQLQSPIERLDFQPNMSIEQDIYFIADDLVPIANTQYLVEVVLTWTGGQESSTHQFNVVDGWTDNKQILFYPIEVITNDYTNSIPEAIALMNAVYPVAPGLIERSPVRPQPYPPSLVPDPPYIINLLVLLGDLWLAGHFVDPEADQVVGVTPKGFVKEFSCTIPGSNLCKGWIGVANVEFPYVVLVEDGYGLQSFTQEVAHELGHVWGHPDHAGGGSPENPSWVYDGFWPARKQRLNYGDIRDNIFHAVINIMCCVGTASNDVRLDSWFSRNTYERFLTTSNRASNYTDRSEIRNNGGSILMNGFIDDDNRTIILNPSYRMSEPPTDLPLGKGDYSIKIFDSSNTILFTSAFSVSFSFAGHPPITTTTAPFGFSMPDFDSAASVSIYYKDFLISQQFISQNSPTVTIVTPQSNQQMTIGDSIKWNASDIDGDTLFHSVLVSNDNGNAWQPLALNLPDDELSIPPILSPGSQYRVKIITTDGFNTSSVISEQFQVIDNKYLPIIMK